MATEGVGSKAAVGGVAGELGVVEAADVEVAGVGVPEVEAADG